MIPIRRNFNIPKRERVWTSRTKFSLRGRGCNIPGLETRNRWRIEVCIAFMHRKSEEFSRKTRRGVEGSRSLLFWLKHQGKCDRFRHDLYWIFVFEGGNSSNLRIQMIQLNSKRIWNWFINGNWITIINKELNSHLKIRYK